MLTDSDDHAHMNSNAVLRGMLHCPGGVTDQILNQVHIKGDYDSIQRTVTFIPQLASQK